jgi:hypothetical protein
MDVVTVPNVGNPSWTEELTAALESQRARTREFLASQQSRLRHVEEELTLQLQRLGDEMAAQSRENRQGKEELGARLEVLKQETAALERLKTDLSDRQTAWEQLQEQTETRWQAWQQQLQRCEEDFEHRRKQWAEMATADQSEWQRQLDQGRQRIEQLELDLQAAQQEGESARTTTAEWQRQLDQGRRRIEQLELDLQAARQEKESTRSETAEWQRQLDQGRQRIKQLEMDLRAAREEASAQAAEVEHVLSRCRRLEEEKVQSGSRAESKSEDFQQLCAERDDLAARLADVRSELTAVRSAASTDTGADEENYHRRYEMALDDLKELKAKNTQLEQELAKRSSAPPSNGTANGKFQNWEDEKKRILAALEAEFDEGKPEDREQRLNIQEIVQKTDALLAEKDREIGELKHLLEQQSGNLGAVAVGAAALGEVLDQDVLIREAREDLKQLQEQLREKMRQAEVEVSIERAKLARQRQDLEERARFLEKYAPPEIPETSTPKKPNRGRWLERLGLKEGEK